MTTYAINVTTGASTQYTNYGFESFCRGHDGKYYGVKSDGLYLLEGLAESEVDFGDLDFETSVLKAIATAYITGQSDDAMNLVITEGDTEYEYPTRDTNEELMAHRVDVGRGLRSNYFGVKMTNTQGAYFTTDAVEIAAIPLTRRI